MREAVRKFAEKMEEQLKANDHKGGWKETAIEFLRSELGNHLGALNHALFEKGPDDVVHECADCANFLMMIADNLSD